jgi:tetratricopeptide (TPR) repeat protein
VLYELLGGSHPFGRETPADALAAILTREPTDLGHLRPELPPALVRVVSRCLEKEPWKRFATAQELVEELEQSLLEDAEPAPAVAGPEFLSREEEAPEEGPVFVARDQELGKLGESLAQALSNQGRVLFVTGDAGSGKTALVSAFARRAQADYPDLVMVSGKCNAHTGMGDPYLPFREVLSLLTGDVEAVWAAGAISRDHALRLWQVVPDSVRALVDSGPDLIDTFVPGRALISRARSSGVGGRPAWLVKLRQVVERKATLPMPPQQSDLFEQYTRVLQAVSAKHPVLLVLDDLQWADAGSIGLLFHLGRQLRSSRVLITGIYRPSEVALSRGGERHPLGSVVNELKRDFGDVEVELGESGSRAFVDALLDREANDLSESFRETLYRQTGGHPLFTVELLRGMQERGALAREEDRGWIESEDIDWERLPARVEAVIAERIGRLPEDLRRLLTLAAVEGEDFTAEVLARIQDRIDRDTVRLLSTQLDRQHHLVGPRDVRRVDGQQLSLYRFRHILYQKYLYGSLDSPERAYLHEDVANALESLYGGQTMEISGQLARHFEEAGITSKAIEYLQQAGQTATTVSANAEAIAHFERALALLGTLPDTPDRAGQELALQLGLAVPLQATRGYGVPEVLAVSERARELCEQLGDAPQLFQALWHLWTFYATRAEYSAALELAERYLGMADRVGEPLDEAMGHCAMGITQCMLGKLTATLDHMERVIDFYDPAAHAGLGLVYVHDPGIGGRLWSALSRWLLGYPHQGLARARDAIALARRLDMPYQLAFAVSTAGVQVHFMARETNPARAFLEEQSRLAEEAGLGVFKIWAVFYLGFCQVLDGEMEDGIAQMSHVWGLLHSMGWRMHATTFFLTSLAEAYRMSGRHEEGLAAVSQAEAHIAETGERAGEPEIRRLKGDLLLLTPGGEAEAEAEASYVQAITIARELEAKSWELRATTSLARLWQKQGKTEEARKWLADVYGWFTEGFETHDLKDAKSLLDELGRKS